MARLLLLLTLSLGLAALISAAEKNKCGPCKPHLCPKVPRDCPAGHVKDECGCCNVCAQGEGELCHHPSVSSPVFLGKCGKNLECRVREDVLEAGLKPEALCMCKTQEALCGSDDVTYDNMCQLMAAVVLGKKKIKIANKGPCKTKPVIFTPPAHAKNTSGSDVALACEVRAYPIPTIEWTWKRVDGKTDFLPSDDAHISTNMRGGPEKYEVTGWLQIQNMQKYHEGDYTCVAQNDQGVAQATARVKVMV